MLVDPNGAQTDIDLLKTPMLTSPNKISGTPRSNTHSELFTFAELDKRNLKNGFSFESSTWGPAANEAIVPTTEEKGDKLEVGWKRGRDVGRIVGTGESTNIIVSQNTQQALLTQEGRKRNKIVSIAKRYCLWLWLNLWGSFLT